MNENPRLIESCCVARYVPELLREAKSAGQSAQWLTMGDVTVKHLSEGVARLAGNKTVVTLVMQRPDIQVMRWVKRWMDMAWCPELRLTAAEDCAELVRSELGQHAAKVRLAVDATVGDELIAWEGEKGVVVICGRMLTAAEAGIKTYAGWYGKDRGAMRELLQAVESRAKSHAVEVMAAPAESDVPEPPATEEEPTEDETKKAKSKKKE